MEFRHRLFPFLQACFGAEQLVQGNAYGMVFSLLRNAVLHLPNFSCLRKSYPRASTLAGLSN